MTDQNKYHNGQKYLNGSQVTPHLQGNGDNDEDEIDLSQFFFTLWNSKWLILSSILLGGILALFIAFFTSPMYQGDGTMVIKKPQDASPLANAFGNSGLGGLLGGNAGSNLVNETKILESRSMSEAIANKLIADPIMKNGRMYPVLWKGWPQDSVIISPRAIASRIQNNIKYDLLKGTTIFDIKYESPSAIEAADMVNLVMSTYKEQSREQSLDLSSSAGIFLGRQKAELKDSLDTAEIQLKQYMDENKLVQLDLQTSQEIGQYASLTSQKRNAEVQLEIINASIDEYQHRLNELKPGLADKLANAIGSKISKLQFQISELESRRALIYSKNPDLYKQEATPPEIKNINSELKSLKEQVKTEAGNILKSNDEFLGFINGDGGSVISVITNYSNKLIDQKIDRLRYNAQIDVLVKQIAEKEEFLKKVPENKYKLTRLKRNASVQEELYLLITKKLAETQISSKVNLGNSRPLDEALIPSGPNKPVTWLYLLVGIFAGGFVAVVYVLISKALDTTINHVKPLQRLKLRVLSVIPVLKKEKNIPSGSVMTPRAESSYSEAFQRLVNNIIYSDYGKPIKSIMFTSSKKGEGNTTVVSNLAAILAEANLKVLVVDMNFIEPDLHTVFNNSIKPGLKELVLKNNSMDQAIQETSIAGVDLLSSGNLNQPIPRLIHNPHFKDILSSLKETYDYILFDAPPVGIQSEIMGLVQFVDSTIIVTRDGITKKPELEFTLEQLYNVRASILGVVLNACTKQKKRESNQKVFG